MVNCYAYTHILYINCMCIYYDNRCYYLFHLQSSDDMKSKLKIQEFGPYCHTVNSSGRIIYDNEISGEAHRIRLAYVSKPVYDAVGANYQVLLGTEQICW